MIIFSIKNEEISYFNRPMFFESDAECKAYVLNVLTSDADRALINLRDKLALYELGSIDFSTGQIVSHIAPKLICPLDSIFALVPDAAYLDSHKALREIEQLKSSFDSFVHDVENSFKITSDEISRCKKRR